jgi:hypothetical protein
VAILQKNCPNSRVAGIGLKLEWLVKIWKSEDWSRHQGSFKSRERRAMSVNPDEEGTLFEQIIQGSSNNSEILHKLAVISRRP